VGATYAWTGPNGFTSNLQNPTINNAQTTNAGNYTVKATLNGCISNQTTATIATTPLPDFSLNALCINNLMTITASPIANSYDPNTAIFNWTEPNGIATTGNPILITSKDKGIYNLTITNLEGCATTKPINILYTTCTIPKGVSANNDRDNETFDLSGFGNIPNLKIYNRYGMIVFDYTNYTNQWHGQDFNGNPLPSATYYYYMIMENGEQKTGWVYLTLSN
jgi:gliding motility-associated-like protein